jgi:hypothetical protein
VAAYRRRILAGEKIPLFHLPRDGGETEGAEVSKLLTVTQVMALFQIDQSQAYRDARHNDPKIIRPAATWMFHDLVLAAIRKLKDLFDNSQNVKMIRRGSEDRQRRLCDNTLTGDVISVAVQTKGANRRAGEGLAAIMT